MLTAVHNTADIWPTSCTQYSSSFNGLSSPNKNSLDLHTCLHKHMYLWAMAEEISDPMSWINYAQIIVAAIVL